MAIQETAWVLSLVLMAAVACAFLWVAAGASVRAEDPAHGSARAYRWRARLFWASLVAGVVIALATLLPWPIAGYAQAADEPDVIVQVTGHQWRWEIEPATVPAGKVIEFRVTGGDVNHNFALYRGERLVAQTQAMPGYVNRLRVRFDEPGEYRVLCLEYCGVAHHGMRAVLTAVQP